MGTTVFVRDFRGQVLKRGSLDMRALIQAARGMRLPLLGHVDEYDDTVFNRHQLVVVSEECVALRDAGSSGAALEELARLADFVRERPHRYLVFNGD